jgi:hypothetical protein
MGDISQQYSTQESRLTEEKHFSCCKKQTIARPQSDAYSKFIHIP